MQIQGTYLVGNKGEAEELKSLNISKDGIENILKFIP